MPELDTNVPPWLQRNLAFREPFDPTPWLQERYRRQVQAQTLPLQIQGMALQNQAHALAIQHQGMINEAAGIELMNDAKDVPILQDALARAAQTPGGSLSMSPPAFSGKRARDAWLNQQKMDADTVYGQSLKERIIDQTRRASEIMSKGGPMIRPGPDGTYNEQDLSAAGDALRVKEDQQELDKIKTRAEAEAKFKQMYEKDPALVAGMDLAKLKEDLLQSQKATSTVAEWTPELETELARQRQLQTAIDFMEQKAGTGKFVEPIIKDIGDGLKILYNPKTGHWQELDKHLSKQQFLEKHAPKWANDNMISLQQAAEVLGNFYDEKLNTGPTAAPAPSGTKVLKWNPTTQKLE